MKVLVTGFEPFGDLATNPAELVAKRLGARSWTRASIEVTAEILPTEYVASGERIRWLLDHVEPGAVLCIGTAASRPTICLERVALNLDEATIPDNAGLHLRGVQIVADGPAAYWSTLPLEAMRQALEARSLPVAMSRDAGAYICNHVFYTARHHTETAGCSIPCGLVHIPLPSELTMSETPNPFALSLDRLEEALACCVELLAEQIDKPSGTAW